MLYSLCVNNKVSLRVFLLHSELEESDFQCLRDILKEFDIEIISLQVDKICFNERVRTNTKWTLEIYYRLLLLDLLPEDVERILYMDVDIIVNKSLKEFYEMDFDGKDMIVTEDGCGITNLTSYTGKRKEMIVPLLEQGHKYFCSGVLLLNTAEMRKRYSFDTYVQAMEEWEYQMEFPDQDILNYVHWKNVGYVDPWKYDLMVYAAYGEGYTYEKVKQEASIVHYATGKKPWNARAFSFEIEQLWWDYAKLTPFYHRLLEEFQREIMFDKTVENFIKTILAQTDEVKAQLNESIELNKKLLSMLSGDK